MSKDQKQRLLRKYGAECTMELVMCLILPGVCVVSWGNCDPLALACGPVDDLDDVDELLLV